VATNQQRRAAERRLLQQQLEERRSREVRRKRAVLIGSIVGTLVVIAAVVVAIVLAGSGDKKKNSASGGTATGGNSLDGVTLTNPSDLTKDPGVKSTSSKTPTKLEYKDVVVGKGKAASPSASVTVQYVGVLYKNGTQFDSSWKRGQAAQFSLQQVVPGFTQGIGGTTGVPPMKIGGRRIIIMPSALGYGAQSQSGIPANSPLVFVVDLKKIGS
jgi:hypothetical protein